MNSQDLSNLQEAYMEVYEGTHPDIEGQTEFASKVEAILASRKKRREQDTSTQKHGTLRQEYRDAIRRGEEILAARKAENRARGTQKEQVDLYDIILSHLLDEGYAETQEQAEAIMVNMSEDWRESIVEGMKPLPVGKMIRKAVEIGLSSEHPAGRIDTRMAGIKRADKMAKVADDHNPTKSKRKEDDNRREGGRKREAATGRPRSNELQDNW